MQTSLTGNSIHRGRFSDAGSNANMTVVHNRTKVIVDKDASTQKIDNFQENI